MVQAEGRGSSGHCLKPELIYTMDCLIPGPRLQPLVVYSQKLWFS